MCRAAPAILLGALVLAGAAALPARARADTPRYRLQADAYGRADPGVAVLSLRGEGDSEWVSAETLVWGGLRQDLYYDGFEGDVLVVAVKIHDPQHRAQLELGRFVESLGALRPVHVDGGSARVRLPLGFRVQTFGGMVVVPRLETFEQRTYEWVAGGRVSRAIGDWGSVGLAYQRRGDGSEIADEEIGVDAGAVVTEWLDANARVAYDLVNPGVSEARAVLAAHHGDWRVGLFGMHRSPSRLLPATSLFSVLGDVASRRFGSSVDWRAAPRLDVEVTGAARTVGGDVGESVELGVVLRLDGEGRSSVRLEGRREGLPDGDWTGVRAAGRFELVDALFLSTELELVVPDDPQGRGAVWPWGLAGLTWTPAPAWELAGAVQASASPEHSSRVDGIARLTYRTAGP